VLFLLVLVAALVANYIVIRRERRYME